MQEFNILKCVECETFQVDLVKKAKKWSCKVCNQKQSIKKIYFNSYSGEDLWLTLLEEKIGNFMFLAKECRERSQEMNLTFHQTKTASSDAVLDEYYEKEEQFEGEPSTSTGEQSIDPSQSTNKWAKFLKTQPSSAANTQLSQEDSTPDTAHCRHISTSEHLSVVPLLKEVFNSSNIPQSTYGHSVYNENHLPIMQNKAELHKKPLTEAKYSQNSLSIEPPQKKIRQIDEIPSDEFALSREDWDALDQLV